MPIMPFGERVLCRSAAWGVFARRAVLPWAIGAVPGQRLAGVGLELGGGGGAMAQGLLDRFAQLTLTVADLDPGMVRVTEARLQRYGARAGATVGDATDLPFAADSFDVVISCLMLHHIGDWEAAVGEAVRVLRPGALFVGYDLLDTAASRAFHHLDGIHDLRSVSAPALRATLAGAGVQQCVLRRSRGGLAVRWCAVKAD